MQATIDGCELYYEVHGMGEPVLFIHGFPLSGVLWKPLIEPMKDDYKLIIPDLRGFGQSGPGGESSMARYAADLAELLDAIGEQRPVVVVGLSMGGYVAFEFYRRYPERVRALVLADTRAEADTPEGVQDRQKRAERVLAEGAAPMAADMVEKLFASEAPETLKREWQSIIAGTSPESIAAALHAMAARPDSIPTLQTINRPTLILVGEEDTITPLAMAETMQAGIAAARLEIIPGAGHMPPVEQPQRFTAHLLQFLDELEPVDQQGWPKRPSLPNE